MPYHCSWEGIAGEQGCILYLEQAAGRIPEVQRVVSPRGGAGKMIQPVMESLMKAIKPLEKGYEPLIFRFWYPGRTSGSRSCAKAPGKLHEGWSQGKGRLIPGCEIRSHTQALMRPRPSLNSLIPACCFGGVSTVPGGVPRPWHERGHIFPRSAGARVSPFSDHNP